MPSQTSDMTARSSEIIDTIPRKSAQSIYEQFIAHLSSLVNKTYTP